MRCSKCKSLIDDDSKFCPRCGQENNQTALYCKNCGEKLNNTASIENNPSNNHEKDCRTSKKSTTAIKDKFKPLASIISMSLMMGCLVLIFALSFAPFGSDNFFPSSIYTIMNYVTTTLSTQFETLIQSYRFLTIAHAFIVLIPFVAIIILFIIFLAKYLPKFVKAIKTKEYLDFSKPVVVLFTLYIGTVFYFADFIGTHNGAFLYSLGFAPILLFIIVPLSLVFNFIVIFINNRDLNFKNTIISSSVKLTMFILTMILLSNLGGIRFQILVNAYPKNSNILTTFFDGGINNSGLIDLIASCAPYFRTPSGPMIIMSVVYSAIPFFFEIIILVLNSLIINHLFSNVPSKHSKSIFLLVVSAITLSLAIPNLIFNSLCSTMLNQINDSSTYGGTIICKTNNIAPTTYLILSIILVLLSISLIIYERITTKSEVQNEKNN